MPAYKVVALHDRQQLADFLLPSAELHLYALGDLDDFFWPYTNWYGLLEDDQLCELVLCYMGAPGSLVMHALTGYSPQRMGILLQGLLHVLAPRLYTHLSPGVLPALSIAYHSKPHGQYDKMALRDQSLLGAFDTRQVQRLSPAELGEVQAFYDASYPGNWFDGRMLETGQYYGLRVDGSLVCAAGVHVYSPSYRVAALGNITTRPDMRGRGLARLVTARLCRELLNSVNTIGLNVRSDNSAALACYTALGFRQVAVYEEYDLIRQERQALQTTPAE